MKLEHTAWTQSTKGGDLLIVLGSFEQHGPHLPLNTDTVIAQAVSDRVSEQLKIPVGPTIPVGVSQEHMGFPNTLSFTKQTYLALVSELIVSARSHGIENIYLMNGHGGNNSTLEDIDSAYVINLTNLIKPYDHAGEVETSIILYVDEDLVLKDEIRSHEFRWPKKGDWKDTRDYSKSGVLGDPTHASAEKGKTYLENLCQAAVEKIRQLKSSQK